MDIEQKLRELLVPRDPGATFTDSILSRVGDVPHAPAGDGVVRLADARARWRSRRLLLGVVVVVAAAAAMLPLLPDRGGEGLEGQQTLAATTKEAGSPAVNTTLPVTPLEPSGGETALDCIDTDILHGLLLPGTAGQGFRITDTVPAELASFKPPRELSWLGSSERHTGAAATSSAVYRASLGPEGARAAAAGALAAAGWQLHSDGPFLGTNVFVSGSPVIPAQTWCRDGMAVNVSASALDGVTYVVLSAPRQKDAAGFANACEQPRFMGQLRTAVDDHLPTLELPPDPANGRPVALRGSGGGLGGVNRRQASASFSLKDSADGVARHFASQMAGQGWSADASWGGTGTAGSTWIRRMDADTLLQATLAVSAFGDDRFTVVFSVVTTN